MNAFFLRPEAWPVLALAAAAGIALLLLERARRRRIGRLLPRRAPPTDGGRLPRRALFVVGVLLATLAVLSPAWGEPTRRLTPRGADVIACLDVSRSMLASDRPPSRLESAKRGIRALAERARGDRVGLVVFAGEARLLVPLTRDLESFGEIVGEADPTSVARGGTDLGAALATALASMKDDERRASIVLLTDGEDLGGRGLAAAAECARRGVVVHCVGFGSTAGAKVTVADAGGAKFLKDRAGRDVVTSMDPVALRRIAEATGGAFVEAAARPHPLVDLYEERIAPVVRRALEEEERRERPNRFQWPLAAAFALWILELCRFERRR